MGVLVLTAVFSLDSSHSLPTTANYIVVFTPLAPVIVAPAASHGLEVPLIAVHLFVFYFRHHGRRDAAGGTAAYAAVAGADLAGDRRADSSYEIRTRHPPSCSFSIPNC